MRKLVSALAGVIALSGPAAASDVTDYELDNGMQVVVIEDHRAPVVVHMVWYRAGAADEDPGVSGIAHFLEHLMFKATDNMEAGELSRVVAANGGSDNAFTTQDYTAYYQRVAADRLDLMMEMEADRMRHLLLTEEDVATERDVILEERSSRIDSDPGALFGEQMKAAQYLNNPYRIPTIGWRPEMEQLDREDVLAFYRKYYAPNDAVLVVAGDVEPEDVLELAKTYYGPLEPTPGLGERARPQEPIQNAPRRLVFSDPRVSQPYLMRSYLAPERDSGNQEDAAALTYLAEILGGSSATSVLGRAMEFDDPVSVYTGAGYAGVSLDDTTFRLIVVPAQGVTLDEAEAKLDETLTAFLANGIDDAQFERLKFQIRASEVYALDNVEGLANRYGAALTSGLTIEDVQAWPQILDAVTPEDVMAAATRLFDPNNSVTGYLMKTEEEVMQ